jgi:hypothetical protein
MKQSKQLKLKEYNLQARIEFLNYFKYVISNLTELMIKNCITVSFQAERKITIEKKFCFITKYQDTKMKKMQNEQTKTIRKVSNKVPLKGNFPLIFCPPFKNIFFIKNNIITKRK